MERERARQGGGAGGAGEGAGPREGKQLAGKSGACETSQGTGPRAAGARPSFTCTSTVCL